MRNRKIISVLLIVLCLLFIVSGCGAKKRESVKLLQGIQPTTLNSLYPVSGSQVAAIRTDYENERTTVMLVDVNKDAVCRDVCEVSCIACGLYAKVCPAEAIKVSENRAFIYSDLCLSCGACAMACPRHVIHDKRGILTPRV